MTDKQANELIKTLGQGLRQLDKRLKAIEELLEILVVDVKMNGSKARNSLTRNSLGPTPTEPNTHAQQTLP